MKLPVSKCVIAVAFLAIETAVSTGQSPELVVIDLRVIPVSGVVAVLAIPWKTRLDMAGIGSRVVLRLVTGIAVGRSPVETIAVAFAAVQISVCPSQTEELVVICDRAFPGLRPVTVLAVGREACLDMIRVVRSFIVLPVTVVAFGRRALVAITMAVLAIQTAMGPCQTEELVVVEIGAFP